MLLARSRDNRRWSLLPVELQWRAAKTASRG